MVATMSLTVPCYCVETVSCGRYDVTYCPLLLRANSFMWSLRFHLLSPVTACKQFHVVATMSLTVPCYCVQTVSCGRYDVTYCPLLLRANSFISSQLLASQARDSFPRSCKTGGNPDPHIQHQNYCAVLKEYASFICSSSETAVQ